MSKLKDKKVAVYEIVSRRDISGSETTVKKYIHDKNNLWAYVREMSEKEMFSAKAVGVDTTTVFILNYNEKLKCGQYIDFKNNSFLIEQIDGFEYYKRDLTIRAKRIDVGEILYEEYDKQ